MLYSHKENKVIKSLLHIARAENVRTGVTMLIQHMHICTHLKFGVAMFECVIMNANLSLNSRYTRKQSIASKRYENNGFVLFQETELPQRVFPLNGPRLRMSISAGDLLGKTVSHSLSPSHSFPPTLPSSLSLSLSVFPLNGPQLRMSISAGDSLFLPPSLSLFKDVMAL